jgi:hypothetical protein
MERKWLESFYKECGREVSLAYNVLNQTNYWGITLAVAVVTTCFLGTARLEGGRISLTYPTLLQWYLVIFAWIIMVRFFVRSALGLVNMYRWNELIYSTCKVLSLPDGNPDLPLLNRNLAEKIEAYFFNWKSPQKRRFIVWHSLKLMYLWFFLILLALFIWGIFALEKNALFWVGVSLFITPTIIEIIWFYKWDGLKYQELDLETENAVKDILNEKRVIISDVHSDFLILGFCEEGPFRHAKGLLNNPTVNWLPWAYQSYEIHPAILARLSNNVRFQNQKVAFASWKKDFTGPAEIIRYGRIDYLKFVNGNLQLTIMIDELKEDSPVQYIEIKDPKTLFFFG